MDTIVLWSKISIVKMFEVEVEDLPKNFCILGK